MTKYREILRLESLGISQRNIALSVNCSRNTVAKVLTRAKELNIAWPIPKEQTDADLEKIFFSNEEGASSTKRMPDYEYVRKELLRNGVTKKLLWTEYLEECRQNNDDPLMYSQFCYYIQQDEQKRRATMHIDRKPAEQVEVDWTGDPAKITNPDTGEIIEVPVFVGVMSYSQYAFVEAFPNEKLPSWIQAHVHMYEFFGGVPKILVPDNTKTAVTKTNRGYDDPKLHPSYYEMAEHYGTAVIPARVRKPKDKPNAEGGVGNVSTWIIAALRNEQFFSLSELNREIRKKLTEFNRRTFQKKEGNRVGLFFEEIPFLAPLPATPYELAEWKQAAVQLNYHISLDGMLYSVPFEYIKKKVDVRATETTIEVFYKHERIASHRRLKGRKGQYSTVTAHMPKDHQQYLEWNGDRFRNWAKQIGTSTYAVVDAILKSRRVEQQSYRGCMGLLKLSEKYSAKRLEAACSKALSYTATPSYKSISGILAANADKDAEDNDSTKSDSKPRGITRGADYYRR